MNVLVLIRKLDQTPLQREIRNGNSHGDIISFYNENNEQYNLIVDAVEYSNVVQACVILKEDRNYLYIQYGLNSNLSKLDINYIEEINCFRSI